MTTECIILPLTNILNSPVCPFTEGYTENLSLNYNPFQGYQFSRYCPNFFRIYKPNGVLQDYESVLLQDTTVEGECLRKQLINNQIQLFSLEELFIRLVPSIKDTPEIISCKDSIRNRFIAYCLNIEKSSLYYSQGKLTCNNNYVAWNSLFDITFVKDKSEYDSLNVRRINGSEVPMDQKEQYVQYTVAVNFASLNFTTKKKNPLNIGVILRLINGLPVDYSELTQINYYEMIYWTFVLMSRLFSYSGKLLNGLNPGLPQDFIALFFPFERQLYYYNYYITWIQSRDRYLGFGQNINVSNGDGTYIQTPNKIIYRNSF